jgi:predicted nucleic acid-binding protein
VSRLIIDTNVLIDASRSHPGAVAFLDASSRQHELWSVTPVLTELRWGMVKGEQEVVDELIASMSWLDVDIDLAERAGEYGRLWRRSHNLSVVDAIIAAAADVLGAEVATLNVRHFPMFPDLRPPY